MKIVVAACLIASGSCALASAAHPDNVLTFEEAVRRQAASEQAGLGVEETALKWVPGKDRFVYERRAEDGSMAIHLFDVSTGSSRMLATGSQPEVFADGRGVLYTRTARSDSGNRLEIRVVGLDGSNDRCLHTLAISGAATYEVHLSPKSRKVLFRTTDVQPRFAEPAAHEARVEVYPRAKLQTSPTTIGIFDIASGQTKVVLEEQSLVYAKWLDDETVLYSGYYGAPLSADGWSDLCALDLKEGKTRILISKQQRQPVYAAAPNPAGDTIAVWANVDARDSAFYPVWGKLAFYSVKTKALCYVELPRNGSSSTRYAWSADGKTVAFSFGTSTLKNLYRADRLGKVTQLTSGAGIDSWPSFSQSGRLLAWRHQGNDGSQTIRIATLNGANIVNAHDALVLRSEAVGRPAIEALSWPSTDGLKIDGYVAFPRDYRPGFKYPTVVIVHGGPSTAADWAGPEWPGGAFFTQVLTDRGYLVFFPDYRLSQNFGFDAVLSAREEPILLRGDFDDIMSGVDILEKSGSSDPARMAIVGHSWGSVEVNWIITQTRRFATAISYEGGDMLFAWGAPGVGPNASFEWYMKSTPATNLDKWLANSPFFVAKNVTTPTLFINAGKGANSPSLPWLHAMLKSLNVPTQYLYYPDEPHVVAQSAARIDLLKRVVDWLENHGVKGPPKAP